MVFISLRQPTFLHTRLFLFRALCREKCNLFPKPSHSHSHWPVIQFQCTFWLNVIALRKKKKKQQNTNMLFSKRSVKQPSCGLDRLVKQRGDVFLLVSVSRTQHHYSILHRHKRDAYICERDIWSTQHDREL